MDGEHMSKYRDYNTHVFPLIWGPTPGKGRQGKGEKGARGGAEARRGEKAEGPGDGALPRLLPPRGANNETNARAQEARLLISEGE